MRKKKLAEPTHRVEIQERPWPLYRGGFFRRKLVSATTFTFQIYSPGADGPVFSPDGPHGFATSDEALEAAKAAIALHKYNQAILDRGASTWYIQ